MIRYECPNGHVFESALTMPCPTCDANVTCVPLARLIEQGGEIERLHAAILEHRAQIVMGARSDHDLNDADEALWRCVERSISGVTEP